MKSRLFLGLVSILLVAVGFGIFRAASPNTPRMAASHSRRSPRPRKSQTSDSSEAFLIPRNTSTSTTAPQQRPRWTSLPRHSPMSGHQKMLNTLLSVRDRKIYEHVTYGDSTLESEEASLTSNLQDPPRRFASLMRAASRRLWRGDTQLAIEHLNNAFQLCEAGGEAVPAQIREQLYFELGLASLRLGENENCVNCNNGESCLLPISNAGIHIRPQGSEQATEYLLEALKLNPYDMTARWLLNIACMTLGKYPAGVPEKYRVAPKLFESEKEFPHFPNTAIRLGLNTTSLSGGSIVDDFDGDGDLDVVTSSWGEGDELQFFRNQTGTFENDSDAANLSGIFGGLNLLQADYDNDGDLDLLVLRGAWLGDAGRIPNSLLQNDGAGCFTDVTYECGLAEHSYPTQTAAWLDFDNDGDLDLYIGNENFPAQLFENINGRSFQDIAVKAGLTSQQFTKGVTAGDYNNDGYTDLYVSNLNGPNSLYRNNQNGRFTDVASELNVTGPVDSFPTWFWDYNQDGHLDLFVAGYSYTLEGLGYQYFGISPDHQFCCLYEGDGRGGFKDVTQERHLNSHLPTMGANFGDLDNDGFPDFYLGTGSPMYEALMPNLMYWNQQGQCFSDITTSGGFGHLQKGHGISFADFDDDGDQDVFSEMGGAYPGDRAVNCVYENPGFGNHWITLHLIGRRSNRSAIGTRIRVAVRTGENHRTVYKWVGSGGSFGANPLRCEIGLGQADSIETITIFWPATGITQTLNNISMDQMLEIREPE